MLKTPTSKKQKKSEILYIRNSYFLQVKSMNFSLEHSKKP
ncbi:hypothetical protein LBBP_02248 [Leptospira borgpetersenii serovar Ballum]|uniref:Uncharacterized protein n=1 Tax=Leptospira borgpetersenii serovar Ballum TaxID=280505 RepID=A0A0S2ISM4_LEPBO|nr:hypothetical protein LBBP_02248 [Leptospira borgpetersenii serovar Ballum]